MEVCSSCISRVGLAYSGVASHVRKKARDSSWRRHLACWEVVKGAGKARGASLRLRREVASMRKVWSLQDLASLYLDVRTSDCS